jgi:hypothetical protein
MKTYLMKKIIQKLFISFSFLALAFGCQKDENLEGTFQESANPKEFRLGVKPYPVGYLNSITFLTPAKKVV